MAERKKRRGKIAGQRNERILRSAVEVFTRKGYAAATIPEIARAAGVAAGTIYLYFPNKRELFIASVKNIILTTPLLKLIGKIPTGNFEDVFKHIILDRFELIKSQSEVISRMPSLIGEVQRDPELKELWLKDFLQPFLGKMEMAYRILNASGKARSMEPAVVVRMIGGMILGFLMFRVMEGDASPLSRLPPEKLAENILDFVLHGLMADTGKKKDGSE